MTIIVVALLGIAAVGFMLYVFIAFCRDHPSEKCHVQRIATRIGTPEIGSSEAEISSRFVKELVCKI